MGEAPPVLVMRGAVGACVMVAGGSKTGRCGATSPGFVVAVLVIGGIWAVNLVVVPAGSVIITCYSDISCVAS